MYHKLLTQNPPLNKNKSSKNFTKTITKKLYNLCFYKKIDKLKNSLKSVCNYTNRNVQLSDFCVHWIRNVFFLWRHSIKHGLTYWRLSNNNHMPTVFLIQKIKKVAKFCGKNPMMLSQALFVVKRGDDEGEFKNLIDHLRNWFKIGQINCEN